MSGKELELYICNKYFLDLEKQEVVLCNNTSFCDDETKFRRKCKRAILTVEEKEETK